MSARSRKQKEDKGESTPIKISCDTSQISSRLSFSRSERSHSPLSISRSEEKDELAHLNERLAGYIDYVRALETDKERLTKKIKSISKERMSNVEEVQKTYEHEINALRTMVDDLASQKSKFEIDAKQSKSELGDVKSQLNKKIAELRNLQKKVDNLERDVSKYKQDHEAYQILCSDNAALERKFNDMKQNLEAETLLRTDLENKVLGLKEQLDFRNRLYAEEREKHLFIEEEVVTSTKAEYESKLADEYRAIRQQCADELEEYKLQLESAYQAKYDHLQEVENFNSNEITRQRSELSASKTRVDDLNHDLSKKTAEIELLRRRIDVLEKQLSDIKKEHESEIGLHRQEISRLKEELEESFREFTDLMNTKIALDQEILMYRKMLEGEEHRLNIIPKERDSLFDTRPNKRRRTDEDDESCTNLTGSGLTPRTKIAYRISSSASGAIEFYKEQDTQGKCVKLYNTSDEEIPLGNWEIVHNAGKEETRFKFYGKFVMKPKSVCTIWSQNTQTAHNPPADLVMKKNFSAGAEATMVLLDVDGNEQAKCSVKRERIRASGVGIARRGQRNNDEKCLVM